MTFKAFLIVCTLWPFLIYYPVAHWHWNQQGWLAKLGILDFAGIIIIKILKTFTYYIQK